MPKDDSGISKMRKQLYSRQGVNGTIRRRKLGKQHFDTEKGWEKPAPRPMSRRKKKSPIVLLFISSVVFFVLAILISLFVFFQDSNVVSAENIDIEVSGPIAIPGGEELVLQIAVVNRNSVDIQFADLIIEYPEGTRSASDLNIELPRIRESLGTIKPGKRVELSIRSVLFGEENSIKEIVITIEYRIEDSNAIFFKEDKHEVLLSSSPLSLIVDSLKEVVSGQEMEFDITIVSNSTTVMEDVLLQVEYPFGFEFLGADPNPTYDDVVWKLGDLAPGQERHIRLRGIMTGQDMEERTFKFSSGIQSDQNEREISAAFSTLNIPIVIERPFITLNVALNGDTSQEYIASRGREVRADITWTNNLPTRVTDAVIVLKLFGDILNKSSVSVKNGFYRSIDNTIVWSKDTDDKLGSIEPGDRGTVSFTFTPHDLSAGTSFRNSEIALDASVQGKRLSESNVTESVESTVSRNIQVATDLQLSSRGVFYTGPFINSGSLPPKAESETTYTIIWTLTNSSNDVSNATVVASLPSYVRWLGRVSPSIEDITFNEIGGMIEWNVDFLPAGTGYNMAPREVAFQVALLPSVSQIGSRPILVNEQTVRGLDRFTDTTVTEQRRAITTDISTDSNTTFKDYPVAE